jgi:hypothetical protein
MTTDNATGGSRRGTFALGALLVILGGLFLVAQVFDIDVGRFTWPFLIILPGVLLLAFGVATEGGAGEALAVLGSITTVTGALLLFQSTFDYYQSWAYAWALVFPTSIGLGRMIHGTIRRNPQAVRAGTTLAAVGVALFLVGAFFFEMIIGFGGLDISGTVWAILLIVLGALFILRSAWPRGSTGSAPAEKPDDAEQSAELEEAAAE